MSIEGALHLMALLIGYAVILGGSFAALLWLLWWIIGRIIKLLGYWPLFYKTMMRIAYERNTKKRGK